MTALFASQPIDRRCWLQRTVAGLGLAFALPTLDARAAKRRGSERPTSLITLFLDGGPSQLETWDPHPGTGIGGDTTEIETRLPGLKIGSDYQQTAEIINELSVIRSLVSSEGNHARGVYLAKTGYTPDLTLIHPAIGAILARERWDNSIEIPQHVSLGTNPSPARGGFLGARYDAYKVYDPGGQLRNVASRVKGDRQSRRLEGLKVVSRAFSRGRLTATRRTQHQLMVDRALSMMSSDQLKAFQIDDEPRSRVELYGDSRFGRGCLVARKLVQAGVRAIEVTLPGWDSHGDNFETHRELAAVLDPALFALITDLKKHDLLDSTIVMVLGEFGRTPTVNALDGRDHWPSGFSALVGGGGLAAGRVLGATDPSGRKRKPDQPIPITDLLATVLSRMGVDHEKKVVTPIGRPMAYCEGTPIPGLL